jgi:hypothetical protein
VVIRVVAQLHKTGLWILIPIAIGDRELLMVLDSGSPATSISLVAYERLSAAGSSRR